jgi:large subunit ribosomal protein L15
LIDAGLVRKSALVKILGYGEINQAISLEAHKFSTAAIEKINNAGGTITEVAK